MKGCIVLQGDNTKIGHALALELAKNHGITRFCAYAFGPYVKKFINSQNDVKYTSILVDHELHKNYKATEIDFQYLKEFEETCGLPNLWPFFYGDRALLLSTPPKDETTMELDAAYDYDNLLRIFLSRAKAIEAMLDKEKPDFILFFTIGAIAHKILFQLAKKKGIKTYVILESRIGDRVTISESFHTITGAEKLFLNPEKITDGNIQKAKVVISNFKKTGSLDLEYFTTTVNQFILKKPTLAKRVYNHIFWICKLTINYFNHKDKFLYGTMYNNPLRFILYKLKRKIRKIRGFKDLYSKPKLEEKFVFYPLHLEPEQAILDYAPYYINQLALIEQIARALPIEMKLYIKDHPMMANVRPRSDYKKLLNIPNVRLIDVKTKSFDVLKNCSLVITTNSTAGWEALFLGKPVITFGNVFYNLFPSVKRCAEIEKLYQTIQGQLNNHNFNEELFTKLVACLIQDSTEFRLNTLWFENYEKIKNDPGIKNFSRLIAEKLKG